MTRTTLLPSAFVLQRSPLMNSFPEMEHDDPNAMRIAPNRTGEALWEFTKGGELNIPASSLGIARQACSVPSS
jgi:uncharacterized cupredoxin-like copper-binding protein